MPNENLNIHQKLLKIADMAGVLQKTKDGFNYRYVPEEEIQAKVTAGMQMYNVMLYPSITPGTLNVTPFSYEKKKGQNVTKVNEVIVHCEVTYTWVNTDNPEEKVECGWAYIGQMEDASQAFGSGATYGNRYYLIKALQLATSEADPDAYRSKQKEAEQYEAQKAEGKKLDEEIKKIIEKGKELMLVGISKDDVNEIIGKCNNGSKNPNSIKTLKICKAVLEEFKKLEKGGKDN